MTRGDKDKDKDKDKDDENEDTDEDEENDDNDKDDDDDDNDNDNEKVIPLFKSLPQRVTRGVKTRTLEGDEAEYDDLFWGQDTWVEEADDVEWEKSDESSQVGDEFDSDFGQTSSSEEEKEEQRVGKIQELEEKQITKDEFSRKRKTFNYELVEKRRKKQHPKTWTTSFDSAQQFEDKSAQTQNVKRKPSLKKVRMTQTQHLAEAKKTELLNSKLLLKMEENLEQQQLLWSLSRSKKLRHSTATGGLEIFISWSSNRLLQGEEEPAEDEEVHERQLIFFADLEHPKQSHIPWFYSNSGHRDEEKEKEKAEEERDMKTVETDGVETDGVEKDDTRHKYRDPVTQQKYNTIPEFKMHRAKLFCEQIGKMQTLMHNASWSLAP